MKRVGYAVAAAIGSLTAFSAPAGHAADLPTKKEAAPPPPVNCFASIWTYLDSTAADCPLSWGPFTVYATLDGGLTYESNGAPYNARWNNGVDSFVQKQSYGARWLWSPNNLSQSVAGIKMSQPLAYGWSFIGTFEWGFNPYYGFPAAAQQSQVNQNGKALLLQGAGADSSRTGQPDNSQGFIGVSNTTYGTLTAGRVNTLSLDAINSYDPMGGSYAFSPLGFSGSFAGFGDTEAARANTALKYRLDLPSNLFGWSGSSFRVGGLWQWGGYDQLNGTNGMYQGQVGGDFNLFGGMPWAGTLSLDAIGSYAKDAVNLSTFTGSCATLTTGPFIGQTACTTGLPQAPGFPAGDSFYSNTDLKATLSNNTGVLITAKYKWQALTVYGGYSWLKQADPSDTYPNGFQTIGSWNVPGTIPSTFPGAAKNFPTQWISYTTYAVPRIAPYFWVGAKYAVTPQLDVTGAFYYLQQSNYSTTACAGAVTTFVQPNGNKITVARANSGSCAGTEDFFSALIDYRPLKRVDLYAGLMISNVYAGLANGFPATQNISPTAGIRIKF
jgi:predicted porin